MVNKYPLILGIESSCDDTSAAIIHGRKLLANFTATQDVHEKYGGVVPELASRAHQANIIPVVHSALDYAKLSPHEIDAIAFTRGPGLLGSLIVGSSFAKGFSLALNKPLISVNHLNGHILSHFIIEDESKAIDPKFPFLCLLVSGGHSQIVLVKDFLEYEILGETIDDAAGEAFDKCAKVMGLPYPGGKEIDFLSKSGNPEAFKFGLPRIKGFDYSFSGLKTSFLYKIRDNLEIDKNFINNNKADLAASLQKAIIDILIAKLRKAVLHTGITTIALSGGVSANDGLRLKMQSLADKYNWKVYLPEKRFTTDNAAMIAIAGLYKYQKSMFSPQDITPLARMNLLDI
jgi:N6-L-threonylcarbamoyladenine synthase